MRLPLPDQAGPIVAAPLPASQELGRALHVHRLASGLSLRVLARRIGMSAHSGLVDYERGHRILPEDLAVACERALHLPSGYLVSLRRRALAELAERKLNPGVANPQPGQREPLIPQAVRQMAAIGGWAEDVAAVTASARQFVWLVCSMNVRLAGRAIYWLAERLDVAEPGGPHPVSPLSRHPVRGQE